MARSFEVRDGDAGARKFPGPITLFPSREREAVKRMGMSTILGIVMSFSTAPLLVRAPIIAGTFVFWRRYIGPRNRRVTGAGVLRLEKNGFRVKNFFRTKNYFRHEVSDFAISGRRVTFMGGRRACIFDVYDMDIDELAQFMATWQKSATVGRETNDRRKIRSWWSPANF